MEQPTDDLIPLNKLTPGETGIVDHLRPGLSLAGRLTSLGFTPGAVLVMAQNFGRGPLIVTVRGSQVALGRGEASHIFVLRSNL
jgi:ferrous iron transport protein A